MACVAMERGNVPVVTMNAIALVCSSSKEEVEHHCKLKEGNAPREEDRDRHSQHLST
jgi:hypothetical protein